MRPPALLAVALAAALGGPSAGADPADAHPDLHLVPWPKSVERADGYLRVPADARIVPAADRLKPLADVLAAEIRELTGLTLRVVSDPPRAGDIVLRLDPGLKAGDPILMVKGRELVRTTDGAHALTIADRAVVTGFDYRAAAEGTATLLQLLGKDGAGLRLPRVTIRDWPHADYCGAMLDVARQDHPIDDIKKVVRLCRLYKARYLQLHLTDDQG